MSNKLDFIPVTITDLIAKSNSLDLMYAYFYKVLTVSHITS